MTASNLRCPTPNPSIWRPHRETSVISCFLTGMLLPAFMIFRRYLPTLIITFIGFTTLSRLLSPVFRRNTTHNISTFLINLSPAFMPFYYLTMNLILFFYRTYLPISPLVFFSTGAAVVCVLCYRIIVCSYKTMTWVVGVLWSASCRVMCVAVTRLTWFIEASVIWEGLGKGPCLRCLATDLEILFVSALIGASLLWFPVRQFRERERAILELEKEKLNEERRAQEAKEEEKEREKAEREERRSKIATAIMGESVKLFEAMHEVDMEYTRWQRELRMKRERKMSWKRPKEIWRGNDGRDEKIATSWLEGSIYFGRNSSFRKK